MKANNENLKKILIAIVGIIIIALNVSPWAHGVHRPFIFGAIPIGFFFWITWTVCFVLYISYICYVWDPYSWIAEEINKYKSEKQGSEV